MVGINWLGFRSKEWSEWDKLYEGRLSVEPEHFLEECFHSKWKVHRSRPLPKSLCFQSLLPWGLHLPMADLLLLQGHLALSAILGQPPPAECPLVVLLQERLVIPKSISFSINWILEVWGATSANVLTPTNQTILWLGWIKSWGWAKQKPSICAPTEYPVSFLKLVQNILMQEKARFREKTILSVFQPENKIFPFFGHIYFLDSLKTEKIQRKGKFWISTNTGGCSWL